jgi:hypothetical protein
MERIIIGTASWRMEYGNSVKILTDKEVSILVQYLCSNKINSFDTASAYGDVEKILFNQINQGIKIDTKLSAFNNFEEFQELLNEKINLPINSLYFHDPNIFEKFSSKDVKKLTEAIEKNGFKAGFSIYNKETVNKNLQFFKTEENTLQAPAHILDLTMLNEIFKLELKAKNVNFRSFFARGLFFLNDKEIEEILGKNYHSIKNGFEDTYGMSFTSENAQNLSYSLINFLADLNFGCVVGLNSVTEINFFLKKCSVAHKLNINWHKIISSSEKLIDIQKIQL